MRKVLPFIFIFLIAGFSSCIKDNFVDDEVDPELRILNEIDSISIDSSFTLQVNYLNNVGQSEEVTVMWSSADESIATVSSAGIITGVDSGKVTITASYINDGVEVSDNFQVCVVGVKVENMVNLPVVKTGTVATTSSYPLSGSYTLSETDTGLKLELAADYSADDGLPGLYIYLSNNAATISNAMEIGPVTVFEGAHEYTIEGAGINDYKYILYFCKPFNVKVGDGVIPE